MTTVAEQISNLLFTHECVIVPNLGALVSTPVSATIDSDKNLFLPPTKEIGFNRSLSHNDGLLISTLAQKNDISYGKAKVMVEEFVAGIMTNINGGQKAQIEKVGSLKKDALGNLQFVADDSMTYSADAFGLSSFHFTPVVSAPKPVVENARVRRLLQPLGLKQIAASVAIIIGLFATSPSVKNPIHHNNAMTASLLPINSNAEEDVKDETYVASEEELVQETKEEVLPVEPDIYFLIAGSFKTESQAQKFLTNVIALGENQAFVLESPNQRYRVAINGYKTKNEAITDLNSYRNKEDFKTVWVLTQR